jgi:hypothetical protein
MHPRAAIREAFRDRLIAANTGAGSRVHNSRIAPIGDKDELPAILIYSRDEKSDADKDYGVAGEDSYRERTLRLVTEAVVAGNITVDDRLDAFAEQIEAALDDWDVPGFESARVRLIETDIDVVTDGVNFPIGAIGLLWQVRYRTSWRPQPVTETADDVFAIINGYDPHQVVNGP